MTVYRFPSAYAPVVEPPEPERPRPRMSLDAWHLDALLDGASRAGWRIIVTHDPELDRHVVALVLDDGAHTEPQAHQSAHEHEDALATVLVELERRTACGCEVTA